MKLLVLMPPCNACRGRCYKINTSESTLNGIDLNSANYNQYCPFCRSVVYALYNRTASNETTEFVDFDSATALLARFEHQVRVTNRVQTHVRKIDDIPISLQIKLLV